MNLKNVFLKMSHMQMILLCGLVLLALILMPKFFIPDSIVSEFERDEMSFHPDSVKEFAWKVDGQSWEFARVSRNVNWEPEVDPMNVQKRLVLLATLQLEPLTPSLFSSPKINVTVAFGEGSVWKGFFDGQNYFWIEGAKKGFGAKLKGRYTALFFEGELAFESKKINLCPSRVASIAISMKDFMVDIESKNGAWVRTHDNKTVDSASVERWLGRNCQLTVEAHRDLKRFPFSMFKINIGNPYVEFKYDSGDVKRWTLKDDYFTDSSSTAFMSEGLMHAAKELSLIPHN